VRADLKQVENNYHSGQPQRLRRKPAPHAVASPSLPLLSARSLASEQPPAPDALRSSRLWLDGPFPFLGVAVRTRLVILLQTTAHPAVLSPERPGSETRASRILAHPRCHRCQPKAGISQPTLPTSSRVSWPAQTAAAALVTKRHWTTPRELEEASQRTRRYTSRLAAARTLCALVPCNPVLSQRPHCVPSLTLPTTHTHKHTHKHTHTEPTSLLPVPVPRPIASPQDVAAHNPPYRRYIGLGGPALPDTAG
jgi:hypothetical protein